MDPREGQTVTRRTFLTMWWAWYLYRTQAERREQIVDPKRRLV